MKIPFINKEPKPITEQDFKDDGYDLKTIATVQPQGGIEFKERYYRTGDGYTNCITIYDIPKILHDNWLDRICNRSGVISVLDISTIERHESVKKVNRSIGEQSSRLYQKNSKTMQKIEAQDAYQSLVGLGQNISQHGETMKRFVLRLYVSKDTEQALEEEVALIRKELESMGFKAQMMQFESKDNFLSLLYSYDQQKKHLSHFRKGYPIQAGQLGGGYYFNHEQLIDERGAYLGTTMTNGSFVFDPFKSDNIRTYFNILVLGKMGAGKSTLLKMIEEDQFAKGHFIRGFDKARDFAPMIRQQGGKILTLDGTDGRINILQIYGSSSISEEDLRVSQVNSYKIHLDKLKMQIKLINQDLSDTDLIEVKSAFNEFYMSYGIFDPKKGESQNVTQLPNDAYPTMSEFLKYFKDVYVPSLQSNDITEEKLRGLEKIEATITEMTQTYGDIFDGITTLEDMENEQVVMFDIEGVIALGDNVKNSVLFTALQLIWSQAMKHGRRYKNMIESGEIDEIDAKRFMFFIDECHNLINAKNEDVVEFIVKFQKEMRKFLAGVIFATQSPQELIPENPNSNVHAKLKQVFALTQSKFLMNMDPTDVKSLKGVIGGDIKDSEYARISQFHRGQALVHISGLKAMVINVSPTQDQLNRFSGGI